MQKKDLVIIGAGPAGLAASIYAARALLDTVTLEKEAFGGQVILTSRIDNYPGVPKADGYTLVDTMRQQAEDLGAKFSMDVVNAIERDEKTGRFLVTTTGDTYDAAAVVYAGGAYPRKAGFEGEDRFAGHGVSYCATCDGMFYRNKQVYVIGGGNSAVEEALFLTRFASKVTVLVRKDHLRADAALVRELEGNDKIELRLSTSLVKLDGNELPSELTFRNNLTDEVHSETFDEGSFGVFVLVGRVPESKPLISMAQIASDGSVLADEKMATSAPGLFVAGDVRTKPLRQIVTAVSDGAVAAMSAAEYIRQL